MASQARVSDDVAEQIQTRIVEGTLKPGDRLPPERQFAQELGISRSSLREAIQKLESRGLLSSRQGGGTYVTEGFDASRVDPWLRAVGNQPGFDEDVFDFREMLEIRAASWAAERATPADQERLRRAYALLDECYALPDREPQIEADVAFHQAIAEAAHNLLLSHLNANLLRLLHSHVRSNISTMQVTPRVAAQLMAQHKDMLEGILDGDPIAAGDAARRHIDYVRERTRTAERESVWQARAERRLG